MPARTQVDDTAYDDRVRSLLSRLQEAHDDADRLCRIAAGIAGDGSTGLVAEYSDARRIRAMLEAVLAQVRDAIDYRG